MAVYQNARGFTLLHRRVLPMIGPRTAPICVKFHSALAHTSAPSRLALQRTVERFRTRDLTSRVAQSYALQSFSQNLKKPEIVLGIETSCDDTCAAVVTSDGEVLGEAHNCQIRTHHLAGGIIPGVARDLHKENLDNVVNDAMQEARLSFTDLSAVSVSVEPGLVTCLRVGLDKAISLCCTWQKPLIPIHHMKAHALTIRLLQNVDFPFLVLLASGGHCLLAIAHDVDNFTLLGRSLHDSPGECLDKIARRLRLKDIPGFEAMSGGQAIEILAREGDPKLYPVYNTMTQTPDCDFSFSGIKSHFNRVIERLENELNCSSILPLTAIQDVAASAQYSITHHICRRLQRAFVFCDMRELLPHEERTLVLSGGVGSNQFVRAALEKVCGQYGCRLVCPPPRLCTDNGVMVAWNGVEKLEIQSGLVYDKFHHMDVLGKSPIGNYIGKEILDSHLVKLQGIKLI